MSSLIQGRTYESQGFATNKFPVPQGTKLVYDGHNHSVLLDVFFHEFHFVDDPSKRIGLSEKEILGKIGGL